MPSMRPSLTSPRLVATALLAAALLAFPRSFAAGDASITTTTPEEKAAALMSCFDGQDCLAKRTAWEHFTEDLPSCLVPARVWWSPRTAVIPVTLVTQLSAERLEQVRAQCATWRGPLAAALYLPLYNPSSHELTADNKQKLQAMVAAADELFRTLEESGRGCQLRLILLYELFADPKALVLYPVNTLRNYARLLADTDLITNIDVDMIPSVSTSTALADPAIRAVYEEGCRTGSVYVWPAFETHCSAANYADTVAVSGKEALPTALAKCLRRMRPKAPFSHNATNYDLWMKSSEVYPITYSPQFEPWFLSWRWGTLWYDYRYRGYGKNKIVQTAAMNATGTSWFVSPHGFLVHRKHTESRARKDFLKVKFSRKDFEQIRGSVYEHIESLWNGTVGELSNGTYLARVERSFQGCMEKLPWWQRPGR